MIDELVSPPIEDMAQPVDFYDKKENRRGLHLKRLTRQDWLDREPRIFAKLQEIFEQMELSQEELESYCSEAIKWIEGAEQRRKEAELEEIKEKAAQLGFDLKPATTAKAKTAK